MFRVCFVVDSPYAGGAERYIGLILDGLDRRYFQPSVLAKSDADLGEWCREQEDKGLRVLRVPMNLPFRPTDAPAVHRALVELAPHVVHVNMPGPYDGQMGLVAPIARLAGAARVVVTEHLPMVARLWKRALVKAISYAWVDRVITVSQSNLPYLERTQRVPAHKCEVIYNGLPRSFGAVRAAERAAERRALGLGDSEVGISVVGSLIRRKGLHVLIEALSGPMPGPWRLFVVGSGEGRESYRRQVAEHGLSERVSFVGRVPGGAVERILSAVDIVAVPSFIEGMPYVILEAMACSLPVVASRVDGIPEAVSDGETGLLVPSGESEALRGALGLLVGDADMRTRLGRAARRRFEAHFTLDRHIARLQAVYFDLLLGSREKTS